MPHFQYKALNSGGVLDAGSIQASNRPDAFDKIKQLGLQLVHLEETAEGGAGFAKSDGISMPWKQRKISFKMLGTFTRLLSSLLAAGVPLSKALTILYRETTDPAASKKWREVHDLVIDGVSLSDAMSRSPETFPTVYTAMVEAGETGGFLDLVLEQIAEFQARDKELRGKVISAMIYPAVLMFLAIAVLIFLMVFFIPRFKTLFEGFDAALPMLTQVIVTASEFSQRYGIFIIIAMAFLVYLARTWVTSERGRRIYERWLLTAPVIGPLSSQFAMARFSRMLGTLIHAGVPLVSGLNVAQRSIGNQILTDAIEDSVERVKKGESLARSLGNCSLLFSGATVEMISVAEESSRLDKELIRLAEVTEKELDQQLKTAVALMEPLMLFFIAAFIGTIFVGMVIPIFTIQDYIK
ncbi:MAG: type II secretion system F family protein [Verrucomicrobiota bacterium]|jgi:type II secretory pathway component PulF|nr:type II secretion system F family protein [Verrucomicrobiota bacterium]